MAIELKVGRYYKTSYGKFVYIAEAKLLKRWTEDDRTTYPGFSIRYLEPNGDFRKGSGGTFSIYGHPLLMGFYTDPDPFEENETITEEYPEVRIIGLGAVSVTYTLNRELGLVEFTSSCRSFHTELIPLDEEILKTVTHFVTDPYLSEELPRPVLLSILKKQREETKNASS